MKHPISFLIVIICVMFGLTKPAYSFTTNFQDSKITGSNQLLRVSVEPTPTKDNFNIYLYTSSSNPMIQQKYSSEKTFLIDLNNTTIATTNNIKLDKISDTISGVRLVPYINTNNPSSSSSARIIIESKESNTVYNIIVKPVKLLNSTNTDLKMAKIMYPPQTDTIKPQSMAFFTPIDKTTTNKMPKESLSMKNYSRLLVQLPEVPDDKLKVTPPNSYDSSFPEKLPDVSKSVTPVVAEDSHRGTESPQPPPKAASDGVKTIIPKQIAQILTCVFGIILIVIIVFIVFILKTLKKSRGKNAQPVKTSDTPGIQLDNMQYQQPVKDTPIATQENLSPDPFVDDVEEIEVIDCAELPMEKMLYLIKCNNNLALVGSVNEDVTIINTFTPDSFTLESLNIEVTKEGNALGKEIYSVKVQNWHGIVYFENNTFTLHTNINM